MAETIKTCDLDGVTAAMLFILLNPGKLELYKREYYPTHYLVSSVDPVELRYPEGWYFAKHTFRNKHRSTTGFYAEVPVFKDMDRSELWDSYWDPTEA